MNDVRGRLTLDRDAFRLDVTLGAGVHGVLGVLGPSGSGKTTLLRVLAGLEPSARGELTVHGERWLDSAQHVHRPAHHRSVGYVPQRASLFPHLDVRANLVFGHRRVPVAEQRIPVDGVIRMLQLGDLLARMPASLSGGEAQRVAIGRALLASPRLMLMDEPLAALDIERRRELLPFIERVRAEIDVPMVYVSHSAAEIATLADHVLRLEAGRVREEGPPGAVFAALDPAGASGRPRLGGVLEGVILRHDPDYGLSELDVHGRTLAIPHRSLAPGSRVRVLVRAHEVSIAVSAPAPGQSPLNVLAATVRAIGPAPHDRHAVEVALDVGAPLCALLTRKSLERLALVPGVAVWAHIKTVALAGDLGE